MPLTPEEREYLLKLRAQVNLDECIAKLKADIRKRGAKRAMDQFFWEHFDPFWVMDQWMQRNVAELGWEAALAREKKLLGSTSWTEGLKRREGPKIHYTE